MIAKFQSIALIPNLPQYAKELIDVKSLFMKRILKKCKF